MTGLPLSMSVTEKNLRLLGRAEAQLSRQHGRVDVKLRQLAAQGEFLLVHLREARHLRPYHHVPLPALAGGAHEEDVVRSVVERGVDGVHGLVVYLYLGLAGHVAVAHGRKLARGAQALDVGQAPIPARRAQAAQQHEHDERRHEPPQPAPRPPLLDGGRRRGLFSDWRRDGFRDGFCYRLRDRLGVAHLGAALGAEALALAERSAAFAAILHNAAPPHIARSSAAQFSASSVPSSPTQPPRRSPTFSYWRLKSRVSMTL